MGRVPDYNYTRKNNTLSGSDGLTVNLMKRSSNNDGLGYTVLGNTLRNVVGMAIPVVLALV